MEALTRSAEVVRVTSDAGRQVEVKARFGERVGQNTRGRVIFFDVSSHDQPRVGDTIYIAIGEVPRNQSRIDAIRRDFSELHYEKVAGALARAAHEIQQAYDVDVVPTLTIELEKIYPDYDWANVMTDSWPLEKNDG